MTVLVFVCVILNIFLDFFARKLFFETSGIVYCPLDYFIRHYVAFNFDCELKSLHVMFV